MKRNVGGADKILRFILGIAAILVGIFVPIAGGIRIVAFVIAAVGQSGDTNYSTKAR